MSTKEYAAEWQTLTNNYATNPTQRLRKWEEVLKVGEHDFIVVFSFAPWAEYSTRDRELVVNFSGQKETVYPGEAFHNAVLDAFDFMIEDQINYLAWG